MGDHTDAIWHKYRPDWATFELHNLVDTPKYIYFWFGQDKNKCYVVFRICKETRATRTIAAPTRHSFSIIQCHDGIALLSGYRAPGNSTRDIDVGLYVYDNNLTLIHSKRHNGYADVYDDRIDFYDITYKLVCTWHLDEKCRQDCYHQ